MTKILHDHFNPCSRPFDLFVNCHSAHLETFSELMTMLLAAIVWHNITMTVEITLLHTLKINQLIFEAHVTKESLSYQ
jgi:hypothetical protein